MTIRLVGHGYRYAVEQIMLSMYPGEAPVYSPEEKPGGLAAEVELREGAFYATAITRIFSGGGVYRGVSRVRLSSLTDRLTSDRLLQKIIRTSFFKAAVLETGKLPVWGAMSGIRPAKVATVLLEQGRTEKQALAALEREYFVSSSRAALCIDAARAGISVKRSLQPADAALYVGIPFCPTRCRYCSFVSQSVERESKLIAPFFEALLLEIDALAGIACRLGLSIISVYIGGGTPTALEASQLDLLMRRLSSALDLSRVREYTVEAGRPDTITAEKLAVLRANGATRISINPQSMSDGVLRAIGRNHTARDVLAAFSLARGNGFDAINMDLIAGLPTDSVPGFTSSLGAVLGLRPENITVHTLSIKKGSFIDRGGVDLPSGGDVAEMISSAETLLRSAGYAPYYLYRQKRISGGLENVGWSVPGRESLYNILIMEELSTILALGAGGVTKLVDPLSGRIERIFNPKYPYEYIAGIGRVIEKKNLILNFYSQVRERANAGSFQ